MEQRSKWENYVTKKKADMKYLFVEDAKNTFQKPKWSLISITVGLVFGMILILSLGKNPIHIITMLFSGSFGSTLKFGNFVGTLSWMIPIGLAMVISFRAGVFNIGSVGQMILGGMVAYMVAFEMPPSVLGWFFPLMAGVLSAMVLGYIIGKLKTKFGINEVLSSIMFNWIVWKFYDLVVKSNRYGNAETGASKEILHNNLNVEWLTNLFAGSSRINIGIFFAIIALVVVWFVFKFTSLGYKLTIVGNDKNIAIASGHDANKKIVQTFVWSSSLAGLAGVIFYIGTKVELTEPTQAMPNDGFNGITVSLLGYNSAMGSLFGAIFLTMVTELSTEIKTSTLGIDSSFVEIINGVIVFFIAISQYFIIYDPIGKWKSKKEEMQGGVK